MPTRRQEALAVLDADAPPKTPKVELLRQAGYSESTATAIASKILDSKGVAIARRELAAKRADSARSIRSAALSELSSRITPQARDETILAAVKVTTDAVAAGVDDDQEALSPQDRSAARAMVLRYCRIAARVAVYRALRGGGSVADAPDVP